MRVVEAARREWLRQRSEQAFAEIAALKVKELEKEERMARDREWLQKHPNGLNSSSSDDEEPAEKKQKSSWPPGNGLTGTVLSSS